MARLTLNCNIPLPRYSCAANGTSRRSIAYVTGRERSKRTSKEGSKQNPCHNTWQEKGRYGLRGKRNAMNTFRWMGWKTIGSRYLVSHAQRKVGTVNDRSWVARLLYILKDGRLHIMTGVPREICLSEKRGMALPSHCAGTVEPK